jgi:paraquat-inducible protein A
MLMPPRCHVALTQPLIACHECDLLHRVHPLPANSKARCRRCGALLYANRPETVDRTLALAWPVWYCWSSPTCIPFLSLESQGSVLETTLITGTIILSQQSMSGLALLVLLTSMLLPCLLLLGLVYVLWPLKRGRRIPAGRRTGVQTDPGPASVEHDRDLPAGHPGVRGQAGQDGAIIPGTALFAFLGLVFVLAAVNTWMDPQPSGSKWIQGA